jgi:import inner membrane translocase subunit TIM16
VAQETLQNLGAKASKAMTEQEARMILGINENTSVEEMLQVIRWKIRCWY